MGIAGATLSVFVTMGLLLGAVIYYYNSVPAQSLAPGTTTITTTTTSTAAITASTYASSIPGNDSALAIYNATARSVVTIVGVESTTQYTFFGQPYKAYSTVEGSGFVIQYNGSYYIITNFHVVDKTTNMTVTFSNGDSYPGSVVGSDVYSDLAVVSVNAPSTEFFPLTIAESEGLRVGQTVYAMGAPFGLTGTFTSGLVSQLGRTIQEATTGNYSISGIVQFTAPINPGNSGGPLLDSNGQVVGITTATISGSTGLGFAIPSHTIIRELPSLIAKGSYKDHSYLGASSVDNSYQLAQASKTNVTYGVVVEQVVAGGPADKAGVRAGTTTVSVAGTQYLVGGDIIVSVNGTRIINTDMFSSYLEENTVAGQTVVLGIIRNGTFSSVTVTLGARP